MSRGSRISGPCVRSARARATRGFTLIEMLLAITIFGLLMIGVYQSFDQAFRAYKTIQDTREVFETARGVMDLLHDDLTSAVIFPGQPHAVFVGRDDSDGRGAARDSLVLYTLTHTSLDPVTPVSDQVEIEYRILVDRDTGAEALVRREDPYPDADHEEGGALTVLTENIVSLELLFYDGETWSEYWDSADRGDAEAALRGEDRRTTRNLGILPVAVQAELVIADSEGREEMFRMMTRLPMGGRRAAPESATVEPEAETEGETSPDEDAG